MKNELNRKIEQMPDTLVREILDFAEFLLSKKNTETTDLNDKSISVSDQQTEHLEEEFMNYKSLHPKEIHESFARVAYLCEGYNG